MEDSLDQDLPPESLIHDMNNVFETFLEAAELLCTDEQWRPLGETLQRSVTRGRRLMLAIPERAPDLRSVTEYAMQSVNDYCTVGRRPKLRFVHEALREVRLPGSTKDWERVFVNLFLNAAQVMEKPGRIEVAASQDAEQITITVSDNGPGISPTILGNLFSPNVSTKRVPAGRSGLGLHIVSSIVKRYSGRISAANSDRGTGAVFTILLPTEAS